MKTPKRKHCDIYKCDKCGGYGITYNADDTTLALYQCSLCGAQWHMPFLPKRTRAIRARMKRKNRETQLKHTLARLTKLARGWEWEAAYWHSQALCAADIADKFRAAAGSSGACGHDIEGS